MASTTVIKVRYFGTTTKKLGDRLRHFSACVDKNGELDLDIGGLREKICSVCHLPKGADITLTYIDEDGDVVTLVDDDDLRDAMRQHLKSFRIDVLMNDDKDRDSKETKKATTSSAVPVTPTMTSFETNLSEAIGGMMCHTGFCCGVCGCDPIFGFRFKSIVMHDYNLCRKCFKGWGNGTDYIRIDHPV